MSTKSCGHNARFTEPVEINAAKKVIRRSEKLITGDENAALGIAE
jgi:hypothetical protein